MERNNELKGGAARAANTITDEQIAQAEQRGAERFVREVHATGVHYNEKTQTLVLELRGGMALWVPIELLQGVAGAAPELIADVELAANGSALHWEVLDADFSIQDIAAGSFGTALWMEGLSARGLLDPASEERRRVLASMRGSVAAELGARGGSTRTAAKAAASRANGAKGGRPRKVVAA